MFSVDYHSLLSIQGKVFQPFQKAQANDVAYDKGAGERHQKPSGSLASKMRNISLALVLLKFTKSMVVNKSFTSQDLVDPQCWLSINRIE